MLRHMSVIVDVMSIFVYVFFFKQKTAYEMRISDWSSDVCSSDLARDEAEQPPFAVDDRIAAVPRLVGEIAQRVARRHRPRQRRGVGGHQVARLHQIDRKSVV